MQHRIISTFRAFMQALIGLLSGADGTLRDPQCLAHGAQDSFGNGFDRDDVGWPLHAQARHLLDDPMGTSHGPAVNVDGTPMMAGGLVDVAGKPYGMTDSCDAFGGGGAGIDGVSGTGSGMDGSIGSSWSSHEW